MRKYSFMFLVVLVGLTATVFTSCNKTATSAQDDSISAQDANTVTNAMTTSSDDATAAAGQVSSYKSLMGLNNGNGYLFVGGSITDTSSSSGIVITYDGVTWCNGITRSGTITITNTGGIPWHEQGAVLTVEYNLTVTDEISGYTYKLTGTHTITNETGGLAWQVIAGISPSGTTVTYRIQSSNMTITFPGGAQRTWTVDRSRSWSISGSTLTVSVSSQAGGGISEQGQNRYGESFTNTIVNPIIGNNNCLWRPYTGEFKHQISTRTTTVVFGTNSSGVAQDNPTYCGLFGTYGYYITYMNGTTTRYRFVSYWR